MCDSCRWEDVVEQIDHHLDRSVHIDQAAMILAQAADVIAANQHVTEEQREGVASVIEQRESRA